MNICIYLYHTNSTSPFPSVPTPANLSGSAVLHSCIFALLKSLSPHSSITAAAECAQPELVLSQLMQVQWARCYELAKTRSEGRTGSQTHLNEISCELAQVIA